MQIRTAETTRTVPVPLHKDLKPGTLASITHKDYFPQNGFEHITHETYNS
jgi:hypothetical protein